MNKYYAILTDVGLSKLNAAQRTNNKVQLTHMLFGDGNGTPYSPTGHETSLKREVWRTTISEFGDQSANLVSIEAIIPAEVGGWTIREAGVIDSEGDLIAIANYQDTPKPILNSNGTTLDLTIKLLIEVNNSNNVTVTIDPNVANASRKFVEQTIEPITQQLAQKAEQEDITQLRREKANKSEINTLASAKADRTYVDALVANVADGSPRDVFYSIVALQSTFPNGEVGTYLVFDTTFTDGAHAFIWKTNAWVDLGVYQANGIADGSVTPSNLGFNSNENLFDGRYYPCHIRLDIPQGGEFANTYSTARSAIIKIQPNKKYKIKKPSTSEWYRVALHNQMPFPGQKPSRYIKDEYVGGLSGDFEFDSYNESYLFITVSLTTGEEPELYVHELNVVDSVDELKAKNLKPGKNLFNGMYLNGRMYGEVDEPVYWEANEPGNYAVVPVKANTTYTVSKSYSSRLKIALVSCASSTMLNAGTVVFNDNNATEATITTGNNHTFMQIYVSNENKPPHFLQVEESSVRTEWELHGYKLAPIASSVDMIDARSFGVFPDGTDVSDKLNTALKYAKGRKLYLPGSLSSYLVLKTIVIPSETEMFGDGDNTLIKLGNNATLTGTLWRTFDTYNIIMTQFGSKDIKVRNLKIEGNKAQYYNHLQWGLNIYGCDGAIIENVTINDINYTGTNPGAREGGDGWGLVLFQSKNIHVRGGKFYNGGYENIGTERVENVVFEGVYCGDGWRTSLQIHRDSKNIKVINSTIKQNNPNAHSALTLHGASTQEVSDVKIANTHITANGSTLLSDRGCIQSVEGREHAITVSNCTLVTNNYGIAAGVEGQVITNRWIIKDNDIKAKTGIKGKFDKAVIKDNVVDSVNTAITNLATNVNCIIDDNLLLGNQTVSV